MSDQKILEIALSLLSQSPYKQNGEVRDALKTLARFSFERMMICEDDLTNDEWAALRYDRSKLKAVKLFRDRHDKKFTLLECKHIIEQHMEKEFGYTMFPIIPE